MALYNFQKRFVPMILSGDKRHTIRARRARQTKVGETCHLYTGLRQKGAKLLMRAGCTRVESIRINGGISGSIMGGLRLRPFVIDIDGVRLSLSEMERLAASDGFRDLADMVEFWSGRTPFEGDIVHWQYPPEVMG